MKHFVLLVILVVTQVLGDICLSYGMKGFGKIDTLALQELGVVLLYILTNLWIWIGVSTLTFSMIIYLMAIAEMDMSYVLPIHGSSYVLNGLMAWLILGENVSFFRWLATFLITIGVLIVGWSEQQKKSSLSSPNPPHPFLLIGLPMGGMMSKVWLGAVTLALTDSLGDLLTAKGMKQIGSFPNWQFRPVFDWSKKVLSSPYIIGGISCQAVSFLIFLSLLSWADISLVRPATAVGYILSLLGAKFILNERISRGRLTGIIVIGLGMGLISWTE